MDVSNAVEVGTLTVQATGEFEAQVKDLKKEISTVWGYYNKKDSELSKALKRIAMLEMVIEKMIEERGAR